MARLCHCEIALLSQSSLSQSSLLTAVAEWSTMMNQKSRFLRKSLPAPLFRNYAGTIKGTLEGVVRSSSHRFEKMKILVVDDNDAIRTGLCEFLERADACYQCEGASDGDEALARATASKPDVVVLDMHMPGMSGLAAARLIAVRLPATKILLHTVHGSDLLTANASRYGVFRVVDKTDGKNLLAAIREIDPSPQRAAG